MERGAATSNNEQQRGGLDGAGAGDDGETERRNEGDALGLRLRREESGGEMRVMR